MYAIDLFCGAGGFSEGIIQAGFHIVFSSDKSVHVKETYESRHEQLGLIQGENTHFELADIKDLTGAKIFNSINSLKFFGKEPLKEIDAIFGGPPCQGFSIAGKRDKDDPRNMLFREYLRIISEVNPKYVVIENVEGLMSMELNDNFKSVSGIEYPNHTRVAEVLERELTYFGFNVEKPQILNASNYGVPQRRTRAIFIASRQDVVPAKYPEPTTLDLNQKVTINDALNDIDTNEKPSDYAKNLRAGRTPNFKTKKPISSKGILFNHDMSKHNSVIEERFSLFKEGESAKKLENRISNEGIDINLYPNLLNETLFVVNENENLGKFIEIVNEKFSYLVNEGLSKEDQLKKNKSLYNKVWRFSIYNIDEKEYKRKIAKISKEVKMSEDDLKDLLDSLKNNWNSKVKKDDIISFLNKNLLTEASNEIMRALLTKKNTRSRLNSKGISPTMLTLPDDFIHPYFNRILTVREMARIQSFDDSFEFKGKRTTGGDRRKDEVPQYTQVGNAVPPLLAKAIALEIKKALMITNDMNINKQPILY